MRRPPKKSSEFIYMDVKKQTLTRDPFKLSQSIINRKKRQLLLAQKSGMKIWSIFHQYIQISVVPKIPTVPSENNHTGTSSNDVGEQLPSIEPKPTENEEEKAEEKLEQIPKGNLETNNEIPAPVEKARLKLKLKLPFRSAGGMIGNLIFNSPFSSSTNAKNETATSEFGGIHISAFEKATTTIRCPKRSTQIEKGHN
jgi:hypothetical protein